MPEPYPRTNRGQNNRCARGPSHSNRYINYPWNSSLQVKFVIPNQAQLKIKLTTLGYFYDKYLREI